MKLNIGDVITTKRKEQSWTQEQLANVVGVSSPAVSKWETGATYPDITLLSPIARALNTTVDELLSYQNELTSNDINELTKKAITTYEVDGFEAGWKYCQKLFQEYPNSIPLKFHLGNLFQNFMVMKPNLTKSDIQKYYRQSANTYEEVLSSGHPTFTYHATIILIGSYAMLNNLDRAEELLNSLPKTTVNPDVLYSSIYALRGKNDEAQKLTQETIRRCVSQMRQSLGILCAFAREQQDMDKAYTLAKTNIEMTHLFDIGDTSAYSDMIKVLIDQGNNKNALNYLEVYVQNLLEPISDYSKNPIYDRITEDPKDISYIKKMIQIILMDKQYASLKDEPRYIKLTEKLHEIIQT